MGRGQGTARRMSLPFSQPPAWVCARVCVLEGTAFVPGLKEGDAFISRNPASRSSWQRLPPPGAPTFQQVPELELPPPTPPVPPAPPPHSPAPPGGAGAPRGAAPCPARSASGGASPLSFPPRNLPPALLLFRAFGSLPFHLFPEKGRILVPATLLGPWQAWAPAEAIQRGDPGPCFAERGL